MLVKVVTNLILGQELVSSVQLTQYKHLTTLQHVLVIQDSQCGEEYVSVTQELTSVLQNLNAKIYHLTLREQATIIAALHAIQDITMMLDPILVLNVLDSVTRVHQLLLALLANITDQYL